MDTDATSPPEPCPPSSPTSAPSPPVDFEAQQRNDRVRLLWEQARVPRLHRDRAVAIHAAEAKRPEWAGVLADLVGLLGEGMLVVLWGPGGTGKTQMGASLILEGCRRLRSGRLVLTLDLFLELRESFAGKSGEAERVIVDRYAGRAAPRVLVLDEVHERGMTEWETRMLTHILNRRYSERLDTVLVTNETADAAARQLGPSIVRRVRECGAFIHCGWPAFV